ncbi:MAG TPA: VWA domain-containing protein [Pyrinomonadaceae bacterium]|jgi:Ca-activated chloride channel family protein|nr:VWA domain-containing protein [Pyrinomonadaceae bacterium]
MSDAKISTRTSSDFKLRHPLHNSPHTGARLRWLALCIVAALLLSSCERLNVSERDKLSRKDEAAAKTANNAPAPLVSAMTMPKPESRAAQEVAKGLIVRRDGDRVDDREFNTEAYSHIDENPFFEVARAPLSTFSIDVDTASYSNTRRFLKDGQLPPKDAVRIEELINYFSYDYPQPKGDAPFSINAEVSACPWNTKHRLVHIGLQGKRMLKEDLPPANLVFLLDVSGSMNSPNKLPLVKSSLRMLAEQLDARDRISIVVYAGSSGLVLPSTPGDRRGEILAALDALEAGGSTNGGEGIQLAYRVAAENFIRGGINRVVLATDGDFNVGVTSEGELVRLIEEKRKSGVFLSVLGFGTGNVKDATMEKLADKGNGNYAYIDELQEARKVLGEQLGATLATIAKDVKIQVEFNPRQAAAYRLIGYENRLLRDQDFNDDTKDAGEIGAGHTVTALYEVVPFGQKFDNPGVDELKYQKPTEVSASADMKELMTIKIRYKDPEASASKLLSVWVSDAGGTLESASNNLKFSSAVAGFGMLLRDSKYKGDVRYTDVAALARAAAGADAQGYRTEFIQLVERAQTLSRQRASN